MVGALLCEPGDPSCIAGVTFFNNVGYLGMCGHGTIGLITTLAYLNRITSGEYRIETPVGVVSARLHETGEVTFATLQSYGKAAKVNVNVPPYGPVLRDVACDANC